MKRLVTGGPAGRWDRAGYLGCASHACGRGERGETFSGTIVFAAVPGTNSRTVIASVVVAQGRSAASAGSSRSCPPIPLVSAGTMTWQDIKARRAQCGLTAVQVAALATQRGVVYHAVPVSNDRAATAAAG